jgi:NAD(P)-dependent dehydrogenase (short-subunit alcohol dehydrogenase family)
MSERPVAIVTGVGPGTGTSVVKRFAAQGFRVAMLARSSERLAALEREFPDCLGLACDMSDNGQVRSAADQIGRELGRPEVIVYNAVGGGWGTFAEIDPEMLHRNFKTNVMGLLYIAREFAPAMVEAGRGAILVTGNTSALRGKPNFAGFAPTKAAQRILSESIARDLGPKGVHVAYLVIDAVIDVPWTRKRYPDAPDDFFVKPAAIADELWHLYRQDRSAWSFLHEIRPFGEKW